jgi:hypothetical protein
VALPSLRSEQVIPVLPVLDGQMAFQDMEKTWPVWRTHHCTHEAGCVRLAIRLETSLPVFEHLRLAPAESNNREAAGAFYTDAGPEVLDVDNASLGGGAS